MEPMLILEWLLFFLFLELSIFLLIKSKRNERKIRMVGETGYIFLFIGYTFMWMFIIIADYYIASEFIRLIVLNIGFSIEVILAFVFILLVERKYIFVRKFFFSSIYFILFIIYIFILIFQISLGAFVSSLFWLLFIAFISFYWKNLYRTYYVKIEVKKFQSDIIKFSLGIILVFIGYIFTTRFIVDQFSLIYRLIGDLLQILGSFLLFFFFGSISSLSELFWKSEIDIIYIIHKSGLLITQKSFQKEKDYVQKSIDS
ncbi:MAG: hypothetical protein GF316_21180, partial [Candidatus Lokiarchaeota archaeon]|nr:hypothetical protein [Candidatus Lokiarchaeota archaeon]